MTLKTLFYAITMTVFTATGISVDAKDLVILWKDGTTTHFTIGNIQSVKFSLLNMEINGEDGTADISEYNKIQSIYFETSSGSNPVTDDTYSIAIYPNPTNGELNFKNIPEGVQNFQIMDITGKMVYERSFNGTSASYNISTLNEGVYFILIKQKLYKIIRL